jgi:peptidoglycan/LPS O-acetylase OafA/YrhL
MLKIQQMTFNELISKYRTPIMGCAMIVIMLFHQPFIYDSYVDALFHQFGYWGVEIFLFVSGFGIVYSLYRNDVRVMVQFQWEGLI